MEIEEPLEVGKLYRVTSDVHIVNERDFGRHVLITNCSWLASTQHWRRILLEEVPPVEHEFANDNHGYSVSYLYGEKEFNLFVSGGMKLRDLFEKKEM